MNRNADSTKDKIIQSAFSFYDRVLFHKVSLSKIASRAGITKAAIYKHFKSRDDLERTLQDRFFEDVASAVKAASADRAGHSALENCILIFCRNKEYLYYFMSMVPHFSTVSFLNDLNEKSRGGIAGLDKLFDKTGDIVSKNLYEDIVFVAGTIILFQSSRDYAMRRMNKADSDEYICDYAKKLTLFIRKGIGHDLSHTGMQRLAELDVLCRQKQLLPEPDSIIKSVSSIIKRDGVYSVTVDAVASEIGFVKSSLYTKYSSWDEILGNLIRKEYLQLFDEIRKNLLHAENSAENLYIIMETELDYFIRRKEILSVFRWYQIQNRSDFLSEEAEEDFSDFYAFVCNSDLIEELPDFGAFIDPAKTLISWIFHMPVFLLHDSESRGSTEESIHAELKDIFFLMECGKKLS